MPHLIVEHSDNVDIDIDALVDELHAAAVDIEALPVGGIRTRAVARSCYRIADGHPDNSFIYVVLRIGKGRSEEVKKAVGEALFDVLTGHTSTAFDSQPLSLGLEIQEIEPATRWKKSNIRDYLSRRSSKESP